ncbi:unnamed protein product [Pedinophyceae sp. YPF-701]|nr:unnamed protein product [Pedinophyceae sp. YPF-701]
MKSYANTIVEKMEDPEKILEQAVSDMQDDLIKMRQASAQVMASQKQLEAKYESSKSAADDWYRRAELALQKGDEELAREALKRRKSYADNAEQMSQQLVAQKKATEQLIQNTRTLEAKLAEAKSKKDTLKARAASAKTSKQIGEMVSSLNTSNSYVAFEKMEEKVMAMEAESEAVAALSPANDDMEQKFLALEGGDVDSELAAMRSNLLGSGKKGEKSLPEGRPLRDAIDDELDALRKKAKE